MHERELDRGARSQFSRICTSLKDVCARKPIMVGALEMAAGAAILTAGVKLGVIQLGVDVLLTTGGKIGAASLGAPAGIAALALGNIGVAALGGAVAIPAAVVALSAATVAALAGYAIGDLVERIVDPVTVTDLLAPGSLVALGVALLLDGARRCLGSPGVSAALSSLRGATLRLGAVAVQGVLRTWEEARAWMGALLRDPNLGLPTATAVLGTAAAAKSAAAASVTVLGSKTLGALGLGLGIVSTPIWPVIAAGSAAAVLSFAAWQRLAARRRSEGDWGAKQ